MIFKFVFTDNALNSVLSHAYQEWNAAAAAAVASVVSDSVRPHRRQPTRLPRPWDSPDKNTGVGCPFLLQCMKEKSQSEVAQLCPTLVTPWTAAHQAPPSMGFSRQKYWSGVPSPSPRNGIGRIKLPELFIRYILLPLTTFLCKALF